MSDDTEIFYSGASRGDFLEALTAHALQGSTVVLEGDEGSGVSTLLGQSVMALLDDMEVVRVDGGEPHDGSLVVNALLQHFDIERDQLAETLRNALAHGRLVVIADNAQDLSDDALMTMGSLKQKLSGRLAYVFGGMPGTAERVKGADLLVDDILDLPELNAAQVSDFAALMGFGPQDDERAEALREASAGLPGPLLEQLQHAPVAEAIAVDPEDRRPPPMGKQEDKALPWRHMAAVAGLLVLVIIIWGALSDNDSDTVATNTTKAVALPVPKEPETSPEDITPMKPSMKPVARLEDLEAREEQAAEAASARESDQTAVADQEPVQTDTGVTVAAVKDPVMQRPPAQQQRPVEVKPEPEPESAPAAVSKPAPADKPADTVAASKPQLKGLDADLGYRQEDWLATLDDGRWFLQITVTSKEANARGVLDRLDRKGAYYRAKRNGKSVYLVLAGDYASRQAALDAKAGLPENLRAAGPFPRKMADIRKEL
ncbi:hypothetical protein A11A3_01390 [Alcanivorax hongdengensis A-11-3]|uniref:SPOR domain-containing protein n=1 Tax=Alcanivorax hongdengensis A-11-3 TaxID=1177179 RepID=L0WGF6_9GAMM|nr:SPOR domain-containing protein [Alcanivorax hongdengensis]EKF76106.1 hypothetical protein A11A3_01390 [Alcanivorax hongdengensis A-11-3]